MSRVGGALLAMMLSAMVAPGPGRAQDDHKAIAAAPRQCGCESMTLRKTGTSSLVDVGRNPSDPNEKAPLGEDPAYVTLNFEIEAKVTGDNPELCSEGQQAKGTSVVGQRTSHKMACTAGRIHAGKCEAQRDCNSFSCQGGVMDGESIDSAASGRQCQLGGGVPKENDDGKCESFPVDKAPFGDDGYSRPWVDGDPFAASPKVVSAKNHKIVWLDAVGVQRKKHGDVDDNVSSTVEFIAFVNGSPASCACHFKVSFEFDGATHKFKQGAEIKLVPNGKSMNCTER